MSNTPFADFDAGVLDMIERSATGVLPHTPTYTDALNRLLHSQQVYPHADLRDGYVTARSLATKPLFHAHNLQELCAGKITPEQLEPNHEIFGRYLQSLNPGQRAKAESYRATLGTRPVHHRPKVMAQNHRDPLHTLILIPGCGPQPGLPGNYLHGSLSEHHDEKHPLPWCLQVGDSGNDVAVMDFAEFSAALTQLQDLLSSAPFYLTELEALGFRML